MKEIDIPREIAKIEVCKKALKKYWKDKLANER
jgi:hypothetical protein